MNKINEELIDENKKMIYKIASRFKGKGYDLEDLYQVGIVGIIKAYSNYNRNLNAKFSTYAYEYIFGEIAKYIREDRNIRVNPNNLKIYRAYQKAKEFLEQKYYKVPNFKEICRFLEISEEDMYNCLSSCEFTISLDEKIDEDREVYETIGKSFEENTDEKIMLKEIIENLNNFERKLINFRVYHEYTQSETAKALGISQVQVSRYENNIYSRIRKKMNVS